MMNNNIIEINNKLNKLKTFLKISCPKIIHVQKHQNILKIKKLTSYYLQDQ